MEMFLRNVRQKLARHTFAPPAFNDLIHVRTAISGPNRVKWRRNKEAKYTGIRSGKR